MKKITAPGGSTRLKFRIVTKDVITEQEQDISFAKFLILALDQFDTAGQGAGNIRKAVKIEDAIEHMSEALLLEDEDYDFLKEAIERAGWAPAAGRGLMRMGYFEAVETAETVQVQEKDPVEVG